MEQYHLLFGGNAKLATTSTGVSVTGAEVTGDIDIAGGNTGSTTGSAGATFS